MADSTPLSFRDGEFVLKGKPLRLFSGAIHYFRIVPEYWQDRLEKARACGLNTVETYVPWNLHEPRPGHFNNEGILDLRKFIKIASDLGLYVIFRPGPYICSEWEFGGLPSWLLSDQNMRVRSNYPGYQRAVERYFSWLLPQVKDLQSTNGGPIIAVQVENEYGSFSFDPSHVIWLRDLLWRSGVTELLVTSDNESCAKGLRRRLEKPAEASSGARSDVDLFNIPGVLPTANGMTADMLRAVFTEIRREREGTQVQDAAESNKEGNQEEGLKIKQSSRPLMVMELWAGWFDFWEAPKHVTTPARLLEETVRYAFSEGSSINLYMFHGGTNFGFMNGALQLTADGALDALGNDEMISTTAVDVDSYPFKPDVTSYDYDAPLTEDGCITGKYWAVRRLILEEKGKLNQDAQVALPSFPSGNHRAEFPLVVISWDAGSNDSSDETLERLGWNEMLSFVTKRVEEKEDPRWMELYVFPDGEIQSYGYIVYRRELDSAINFSPDRKTNLTYTGRVKDKGNILINGKSNAQVDWSAKDASVTLTGTGSTSTAKPPSLDIIVENLGRVNYTSSDNQARLNTQRKGLNGPVTLDGAPLKGWEILALDFEGGFLDRALQSDAWIKLDQSSVDGQTEKSSGPALYRGTVYLAREPADYFVRLEGWHKGVLFVNGFNLGRYWEKGPTRTLYLPAPLLKMGINQVVIFEEESEGGQIVLGIEPQLG
ncbi:beta-galactosidase [Plakobranchus ocellatus]|uniref:Beta-galactosidase n=1 Tax=Plakobranchus ocellatus TaxID=259542 RepID=A0AAV4CD98_9GAST|nr:beta-galactosidase [Plakobranchus ocellatus]